MRSSDSSPGQTDGAEELAGMQRHGRFGSRRLAVGAGAAIALVGAVVGVAAARVIPAGHGAGTRTSRAAASRHGAAARTGRIAGAGAQSGVTNPHGLAVAGRAAGPRAGLGAPRTSCQSVAHVGDSTSVDLISPAFVPNPAERIAARYAQVGVRHLSIDASGGRSIVEELPGQRNGYQVASAWRARGYQGCWVFALGTNDAANVAAGSTVGMMARIEQMMAVAHGEPVMWVNTRTLLSSGPYASANERAWDKTLVRALAKYPNMRIFDWSGVARPAWFEPDGIHYNSVGCVIRAKAIADALAMAFPLHGRSAAQIVR
ncbi:MAG TPA: hypothetical protein VF951_02395 [Streptosporangiaceae bacterium]